MISSHKRPHLSKDGSLVLNAGAIVNLLGTGHAAVLLRAFEQRCVVDRKAFKQVTLDPITRGSPAEPLNGLLKAGLLELAEMGNDAFSTFVDLAVGSSSHSLDDGDAASRRIS